MLTKFGLTDANAVSTPLAASARLSRTDGTPLDGPGAVTYAEIVGSLLWVSVSTRPDIAFSVGALARYLSCPTTAHLGAAKHVLRYLSGTRSHGIVFQDHGITAITAFCDSDYAACVDTRRSTTGFVFTMYGGAVSWASKLQRTSAVSTAEAEYQAASAVVKEALWLRQLLPHLGIPVDSALPIACDNQACISLITTPQLTARTKHIDVIHHFIRERAALGEVVFSYVSTHDQLADILTKALPPIKHDHFRDGLGVLPIPFPTEP